MRLDYHSIIWGGLTGDATGVTSVTDPVYRVPDHMRRALRDIAAAGHAAVEMFDGNVLAVADDPDQLRAVLAEAGLSLIGVYTGANFVYPEILPGELHRIRRAAEAAGRGEIDFTDVPAAVGEVGYDGRLVVELDSNDGDRAEAARISHRFLEKAGLTHG